MGFNIGNQQAGIINNVEGDQRIDGGQTNVVTFDAAAAQALLAQVRDGVNGLGLDEQTAHAARQELDGIERELATAEPDPPSVASRLEGLTRLLSSVGALATVVSPPIGALATMLGALGQPIIHLLS